MVKGSGSFEPRAYSGCRGSGVCRYGWLAQTLLSVHRRSLRRHAWQDFCLGRIDIEHDIENNSARHWVLAKD